MSATIFTGSIACVEGPQKVPYVYNNSENAAITRPPYPVKYVNNQPCIDDNGMGSLRVTQPGDNTVYNPNSLFTVYAEYSYVGPWLSAFNELTVGQEREIIHLNNGNYISAYKFSNTNLEVRLYLRGGTLYSWSNASFDTGLERYMFITIFEDSDSGKIFPQIIIFRHSSTTRIVFSPGGTPQVDDYFLNNSITPTYAWHSWPQLSGNAGMFLMNLSTIDETLIGDGETAYETFDSAGFNIVPQSELYLLVSNLLNGQESKIVFCGDNYITATRRSTFVNDVLTVYVTLKFYFRSDTLIYTSPELTIYSDNTEISRDYLSIMYDDDQEVAATNIIQIWASGKYGINEYALPSDEQMRALYIWLQDNGTYREHVSPYDTGTTDNGGNPGVPAPQDHITDTNIPTLSGLNNGIVTLYRPTEAQLSQISAFLWSDNVLDNFKKYFNNFADNLLNLYILPFIPAGLNTKTFKVGNMTSDITDVEFCTQRFYDIDMGSVNIEKLWDCYLDFAPYTKLEIYLPYLGMHSLDVDEFMCPTKIDGTLQRGLGSVLSLTYRLDILTGVIVAKVKLNGDIRYQFEGRVGATIPLTGQTYASMVQGIVTAGAGLISTIATGGLTAPMSAAAAVAGTVNAAKPSVERVGNISGDASMLCTNEPYIVISRPNKPELINQARYTGFPSYKTDTIGNFEGFTQVIDAHIDGISCTEEERAMILSLLKEGVIL
jgi:hypothetical protein